MTHSALRRLAKLITLILMHLCELDTAGSGSAQALAKPFTWTSPVLKPCCAEPSRLMPHMWYTGNLHVHLLLVAVTACASGDDARFARGCVQALTRVLSRVDNIACLC